MEVPMSYHAEKHKLDGTELVEGLAPGIDGVQDLETEMEESEKAQELPEGEIRKRDEEVGKIDQPPAAMKLPPAGYDADETIENAQEDEDGQQ
jgi:hypothetical protein